MSGGFQCSQEEDERPVSDEGEEHVRRGVVGVRVPELVSDWRCQEITTTTTATHRETSNRSLIQRFFSRSPQLVVLAVKTICPAVDSSGVLPGWKFLRFIWLIS